MQQDWKLVALGGLGGAAIAVVIVVAMAWMGALPESRERSDARIHEYLMRNPGVIVDMTNKLQADQQASEDAARQAATDKLGMNAFFDPRVAFITGPEKAKTTVVEFFDYNCPYCRASLPAVKHFYATHKKDARFAFIDFPIKGPNSVLAARAAIASRKQPDKYIALHFMLMNEEDLVTPDIIFADAKRAGLDVDRLKKDMMDKSVDAAIAASRGLAAAAKVDGTPAFIINGRMREGAINDTILGHLVKQHI